MSTEVQTVMTAALGLPLPAREELTSRFVASLIDSPELTAEEQAEVDASWDAEIERRVRELEEGRVQTIPGEQVMKELREKFGV